jgi:hypothetical protein
MQTHCDYCERMLGWNEVLYWAHVRNVKTREIIVANATLVCEECKKESEA